MACLTLVLNLPGTQRHLQWLKYRLSNGSGRRDVEGDRGVIINKIYADAANSYTFPEHQGKLILFKSTDPSPLTVMYDPALGDVDPSLGWDGIATEGLEIHRVPGGHTSMLQEPHVDVLAEVFEDCLVRALSDTTARHSQPDERVLT